MKILAYEDIPFILIEELSTLHVEKIATNKTEGD